MRQHPDEIALRGSLNHQDLSTYAALADWYADHNDWQQYEQVKAEMDKYAAIPPLIRGSAWSNVFAYGGPKEVDWYDGVPTIKHAHPTDESCPLTEFTRRDVREVLAASEGENNVQNWIAYGQLNDGRFFFITAGCDYTGWG